MFSSAARQHQRCYRQTARVSERTELSDTLAAYTMVACSVQRIGILHERVAFQLLLWNGKVEPAVGIRNGTVLGQRAVVVVGGTQLFPAAIPQIHSGMKTLQYPDTVQEESVYSLNNPLLFLLSCRFCYLCIR